MIYLAAIAFMFKRMSLKHGYKGVTFKDKSMEELDALINEEFQEWTDCVSHEDATIKDELDELADLAITCLLKMEVLLNSIVLPCEDPSPY